MILRPGEKVHVSLAEENGIKFWHNRIRIKNVFCDELGTIQGYKHVIKVKSDHCPVKCKLHNVLPHSVRADV